MPKLQIKTKQEALTDLINRVVAQTDLSDVTDVSVVKQLLASVATEIAGVYYQFTRLADLFDFQRAAGDDLDERAKEIFGATISRISARRSSGSVVFSRAVAAATTVTIPAGQIVKTEDGVSVETTTQVQITATSAQQVAGHGVGRDSNLATARAVDAGADGNVGQGTLIRFQGKPAGVDEVTNLASFIQGRDEESDDAFRKRLLDVVAAIPRSTVDALRFLVLGLEDSASGKEVVFSHVFEDPNLPGTADIYIDDGAGTAESNETVVRSASFDSIAAPIAGAQTATDADGDFNSDQVGQNIVVAGEANPTNNGTFPVTAVTASTITYTNAAGVIAAAPTGTYATQGENLTRGLAGPPADTAIGGEEYLDLDNKPVREASTFTATSSTRGALTRGLSPAGQYTLNPANGRLKFDPPLVLGERIDVIYTYFTGLIRFVQRNVDGDETDRTNFPGWRAAGILVRVLPPTIRQLSVVAKISPVEGSDLTTIIAEAKAAVSDYINNLGISGDVVLNEIRAAIMGVDGVYNVAVTTPSADITVMNDDELPRIVAANNVIT